MDLLLFPYLTIVLQSVADLGEEGTLSPLPPRRPTFSRFRDFVLVVTLVESSQWLLLAFCPNILRLGGSL